MAGGLTLEYVANMYGVSVPFYFLGFMLAWFAQMGLHEGAHAWVADKLGDPVPRAMGKVTFNAFKHIEWNNWNYVISAVALPAFTTLSGYIPMGMAWVMHSRMDAKSEAKIAIAGPIGSFAVAAIALAIWWAIFPLVRHEPGLARHAYFMATAFVTVAMLYGVFNLIPIPPLDGGTVAYHYLNPEGKRLFDQIRPYGFMIIIVAFWIFNIGQPIFSWIFGVSRQLLYDLPMNMYA